MDRSRVVRYFPTLARRPRRSAAALACLVLLAITPVVAQETIGLMRRVRSHNNRAAFYASKERFARLRMEVADRKIAAASGRDAATTAKARLDRDRFRRQAAYHSRMRGKFERAA